jgi:hypothetical protein
MNGTENSKKARLTMAILALVVGLFLAFLSRMMFNAVQDKFLLFQSKGGTDFGPPAKAFGTILRLYYGSIWAGVVTVSGIALVSISYWLYQGKKWAWPFALFCLAIVPIGGLYNFLGALTTMGGFQLTIITWLIGLGAFWAMVLLHPNDKKTKTALFTVLTFVGMIGAQCGIFAIHWFLKTAYSTQAMATSMTEPSVQILRHAGPILGVVLILCYTSIPFIATRKDFGWLMAMLIGAGTLIAAFPVYLVRPSASLIPDVEASFFSNVFAEVSVLALVLVILLLIPYFRSALNGPMRMLSGNQPEK